MQELGESAFSVHLDSMLMGLLRDSEAAKALFEKPGLFKSP